jgi:hypothetical protein
VHTAVTIALLLVIALLAVAVVVMRQQRDSALADAGEDRAGRAVVVVDVRNAHALAARRTQLARALSFVAPGMTEALVHREVVRQLQGELAQQGVLAEVQVRRWPAPTRTASQPQGFTLQRTETVSVRPDVPRVAEVEPDSVAVTLRPVTDASDAPGV